VHRVQLRRFLIQSRAKSNATVQNGEQICNVTLCLLWVVMVTSKRNAGYQPKKVNYYYYTSCVRSLFSLKLFNFVCFIVEWVMPKRFRVLSVDQKHVIIKLVRKGVSQSEVADLFNVNRCTVYRIVRRSESTSNLENLPKSRRPNVLSARDKRSLLRVIKCDRSVPLSEVTAKFNQHRNRPVSKTNE